MSTISHLRRFINTLKDKQMFTCSDVADCGKRGAIDMALSRLVRKGIIVRVASGVYMKGDEYDSMPELIQVAQIKAKAFGKTLSLDEDAILKGTTVPSVTAGITDTIVFRVDGYSSSFQYGKTKVILQSANCKKKSKKRKL